MPTLNQVDQININGNNIDRTRCEIFIGAVDFTQYVKSIDYSETPDIQFDYSLGSRRPTQVGFGNITAEGNISLNDAGVTLLNELATDAGLPSYLYLGQAGQVDITINYTTFANQVKTDKLQFVFFTNYNGGVNTDDVLYSREISMIIGRIDKGVVA